MKVEPIQLSHKGDTVTISCPTTKQKIKITTAQAYTLYRALRILSKKKVKAA